MIPFWLVKWSVSPACGVPVPIVIVAPVTSVSNDDTVTAESTVTVWPAVSAFDAWFAVTTGAAIATMTVSAPVLLVVGEEVLSSAITSMVRVSVDDAGGRERDRLQGRRVLGGGRAAGQGQAGQPSRLPLMPFWLVKLSESPDLEVGDLHRGAGDIGVGGSDRHARVDRHGRTAEREGLSSVPRGRHDTKRLRAL